MSVGKLFHHNRAPVTEKTLLPTVENLTGGASKLLELAERSVRRPGWADPHQVIRYLPISKEVSRE